MTPFFVCFSRKTSLPAPLSARADWLFPLGVFGKPPTARWNSLRFVGTFYARRSLVVPWQSGADSRQGISSLLTSDGLIRGKDTQLPTSSG